MRKKIHLRRKRYRFSYILLIFIFILFFTFILLYRFNKKASPYIMNYAKTETKNITSLLINNTLSNEIMNKYDMSNLIIIKKNNNDEIDSVNFDSILANKILIDSTNKIENSIKNINKTNINNLSNIKGYDFKNDNGLVFFVPFGVIYNNSFLTNLGPKIPIKMNIMGNIVSQLESNIKDYGINSSLIELDMIFEVSMQIYLPVKVNTVKIKNSSPIAFKVVQGKIPKSIINTNKVLSTISLPTNNK